MTNDEKICPIMSRPRYKDAGGKYENLHRQFEDSLIPCQRERCRQLASCWYREIETLYTLNLIAEARQLEEELCRLLERERG